MPPAERTCAACGHPMAAGVLVDYRRGAAHPSEWVESRLETSVWTGSVQNSVRYEVAAYRCGGCGLLALYADTPSAAPNDVSG